MSTTSSTSTSSGPSSSAGRVVRPGGSGALGGPTRPPRPVPAPPSIPGGHRPDDAVDLSSLSFGTSTAPHGRPAGSSGVKSGGPKYAPPRKSSPGGVGETLRTMMEKQVAGLPLGFWVVVAGAVVAAVVMGASLWRGG
jgi:hypothetical protein